MENFDNCSKEELIAHVKRLKAHNTQLQNIIAKDSTTQHKEKEQKSFDFEKCKFRHVLLKFLYLGWNYQGYVTQEDVINTVEYHIFKALTKTCLIKNRSSSNYHRCGRTDKGVSSFSQVISLDVRSKSHDTEDELDYCHILNRVLPDDIRFIAWCPVKENFSARFDCKYRTYKYFFPRGSLDIESMKLAAKNLVGTHDFRNFCKMDVNNGVIEYVRKIQTIEINRADEDRNDDSFSMYVLTITGNAFLWHQIRCIVGVLILIGQHKEEPSVILELLDTTTNPRKPDYHMASEIPLNLYDCYYENIEWIYSNKATNTTAEKLQSFWTFFATKSMMLKNMLIDLQASTNPEIIDASDCLIPGVKPKNYKPLMKRQLCDSLEEKINKKRKRTGEISNIPG